MIGRLRSSPTRCAGLDTSDAKTRRRIICALVKEIQIHAEEVHIVYKVNPRPFAQTTPTESSMPVCWGRCSAPSGQNTKRRNTKTRASGWYGDGRREAHYFPDSQ